MQTLLALGSVIGILLLSSLVMIWQSPESSEYASQFLKARSLALDASRKAYKETFSQHRPGKRPHTVEECVAARLRKEFSQ